MKSLSMKNRTIIAVVCFVAIFATIIALASVYDFQVSQILTKNSLDEGEYIAHGVFGVVGEAAGTSPIYIVLAICTAILTWYFAKNFGDKKWGIALAIIFALVGAVGWWFYIKDIFRYILEHAAAEVGATAGAVVYEYRHDASVVVIEWFIALSIQALNVFAFKNLKKETLKKLFWWVVAVVAATVVANLLIMFVKDPVGRMRYRAINSEVGQALINSGEVQGYTPWYKSNGQPKDSIIETFVANYPGAKDAFKSFPSGHTCAAGMSYAMIMLPDVIDFKHKKTAKVACWATPIAITALVAISRIVVGAHYMSDVTFGGTLAFVCMIIAREIFICKGSHFFALFPKLTPKKLQVAQGCGEEEIVVNDETDHNEQTVDSANIDVISDIEAAIISGEQANDISREIAENLHDGVINE